LPVLNELPVLKNCPSWLPQETDFFRVGSRELLRGRQPAEVLREVLDGWCL
jgi:hypothetical protein